MDIAPMNKTAIISFIIDQSALKLRKVSRNMRKRVHWVLKEKQIKVNEYSERALALNGWVSVWCTNVLAFNFLKGVSNYRVDHDDSIKRIKLLNNGKLRVSSILDENIPKLEEHFDWVKNLNIDEKNYNYRSKCTYNKVKQLEFCFLSSKQIEFTLTRIKQVDIIVFQFCAIEDLDLKELNPQEIHFIECGSIKNIALPSKLRRLQIKSRGKINLHIESRGKIDLVNSVKIDTIYWDTCSSSEFTNDFKPGEKSNVANLLENVKGVKELFTTNKSPISLDDLPTSLRYIKGDSITSYLSNSLEEIKKRFPYLISVAYSGSLLGIQPLNLKIISPIHEIVNERFSLRPKKILVNSENVEFLNNHPELFEEARNVFVESEKLKLSCLTENIRIIELHVVPPLERNCLTRNGREHLEA